MAASDPCSATPSMVVISIDSGVSSSLAQLAASMVQASDGTPFTCTVQAPHEESSQPRFEPVSPRSSRKVSSSSFDGSMASSWVRPLTRSDMSSFFIGNLKFVIGNLPSLCKLQIRNYKSISRHLRIHAPRPRIDPAAHRLHLLEPLLAQPVCH